MTKSYEVVGIGNAVVDVLTQTEDAFLDKMGIQKGIMQLIEQERGELLYDAMEERIQAPGGSVANTLAGLGNLGLSTAFIGRVSDDELGRFYADAMQEDMPEHPSLQDLLNADGGAVDGDGDKTDMEGQEGSANGRAW